jgi:hypothetical protein
MWDALGACCGLGPSRKANAAQALPRPRPRDLASRWEAELNDKASTRTVEARVSSRRESAEYSQAVDSSDDHDFVRGHAQRHGSAMPTRRRQQAVENGGTCLTYLLKALILSFVMLNLFLIICSLSEAWRGLLCMMCWMVLLPCRG